MYVCMCVWVGAWGRVRFFVYTLDFVSMCVYMNVYMHNVAVYHFIVCIWVCVYVREHARERKAERANERTSRRPGSIVGESYVTWGPAATHSDIRTIYNRVIKPRVTAAALGRTACPPAVTHTATPAHPSWQPAGPGANRILPRTLGTNVVLGDRKKWKHEDRRWALCRRGDYVAATVPVQEERVGWLCACLRVSGRVSAGKVKVEREREKRKAGVKGLGLKGRLRKGGYFWFWWFIGRQECSREKKGF